MWLEVVTLLLTIAFIIKLLRKEQQNVSSQKKTNEIPGLKPSHPETGNKQEMDKTKSLGHFLCDLHERFGPIASFWDGKKFAVSLSSPEHYKKVRHLFDVPDTLFREFELLVGKRALSFVSGDEARYRRKLYDQHFMLKACRSYSNGFMEIAQEYINRWNKLGKDEQLPLKATTSTAALTAIARTSFGDYFKEEEHLNRFQEMNDYVFLNIMPLPETGSETYKTLIKYIKELKCTVADLVEKRKAIEVNEDERLFLDVLLEAENLTEEERLADAFMMLSAGYTTSSTHILLTIFYLCKEQDIQDKLSEHIRSVVGEAPLTLEVIPKLTYLKQVLDETLRLFLLQGFLARVTNEDIEIDGFIIPKMSHVYNAIGVIYQDPKVFPNPEKFNPENFSSENIRNRHPYAFKPFGFAGKRQCPGQSFAMTLASIFVGEWCRSFRFHLAPGKNDNISLSPTFMPEEEIWVVLEKRT